MVGGGAIVSTARVLLGVDDTMLGPGLAAAEGKFTASTGVMRGELTRLQEAQTKAKLAQESYTRAVSRFGPDSAQAQRALVKLSGEQRNLREQMALTAREATTASEKFGLFGRSLTAREREMTSFGTGAKTAGGHLGGMGKSLLMTTGLLVGGGGLISAIHGGISAAMQFGGAMEQIKTQTGGSQAEVTRMSKAVEQLAPSVATGPEELAKGLYHVESAGLRGAKALDVLKTSAEGARVGHADLESVTNALVAAQKSGIAGVQNMGQAMGALNAIVGAGNMRMQDLAAAMSTGILQKASGVGLSLRDVGAAMAVMTDSGVPAQAAATRLGTSFIQMAAPSHKAETALGAVGLSALQLADTMRSRGLIPALEMLKQHLQAAGLTASEQTLVIARAFGGGKTAGSIMTLLNQLDQVKTKFGVIGKGATSFGGDWQATTHTAQFASEKFHASLETLRLEFGQALLPEITKLLGPINSWLQSMIKSGKLQRDFNTAVHVTVGVVRDVAGAIKSGWEIFKTAAGWVGGVKNAVEGLLLVMAVNKIRGIATGIVDVLIKRGIMLVGPAAEGEAVAYGTSMSAMGLATEGLAMTIKTALISTGIGAIAVAAGIAAVLIIQHWNTVKQWVIDFGDWIKQHAYVLLAVPIWGPMLFVTEQIIVHWNGIKQFFIDFGEWLKSHIYLLLAAPIIGEIVLVITHFNDLKKVAQAVATFFGTVFTHPIRAIENLFTSLWNGVKAVWHGMEIDALKAALAIVEPFSHIPGWLGGGPFRKLKSEFQGMLSNLEGGAATAGTTIGTNLGQNLVAAATPYFNQIGKQVSQMMSGSVFSGGGGGPALGGKAGAKAGYANPYTGFGVSRTDMGKDFSGNGPIRAIGPGIVYAVGYDAGWSASAKGAGAGGFVGYTLVAGPRRGWSVYVAESIIPKVRRGQKVDSSTVIAIATGPFETGWSGSPTVMPRNDLSLSSILGHQAHGSDPGAQASPEGQDFWSFLGGSNPTAKRTAKTTPTPNTTNVPPPPTPTNAAIDALLGSGKHKTKVPKLPLVPYELTAQLDEAAISKSIPKQLAVLRKIQKYLEDRIAVTKDMPTKVKLLGELKKTIHAEAAIGGKGPIIPLNLEEQLTEAQIAHNAPKQIAILQRILDYLGKRLKLTHDTAGRLKILREIKKTIDEQGKLETSTPLIPQKFQDELKVDTAQRNYEGNVTVLKQVIQYLEKRMALTKNFIAKQKIKIQLDKERTALTIAESRAATQAAAAQVQAIDQQTKDEQAQAAAMGLNASYTVDAQGHLVGDTKVVWDPKTGQYVLAQVAPDVVALKNYRDTVLLPTLNKLQKQIVVLQARIKKLAAHPQMNAVLLGHLRKTLAALVRNRTALIALINDITNTITQVNAALSTGPNTGQAVGPNATFTEGDLTRGVFTTDATGISNPSGGGGSGSSGSSGSTPAQSPHDQAQAQRQAYAGDLTALMHDFGSNVGGVGPYAQLFEQLHAGGSRSLFSRSSVQVQAFFPMAPTDPHLFSQALHFELAALLG